MISWAEVQKGLDEVLKSLAKVIKHLAKILVLALVLAKVLDSGDNWLWPLAALLWPSQA